MGLFRFIIFGLFFYFIYKVFSNLLRLGAKDSAKVSGKSTRKRHIDLNDQDVEDADFEEID